MSKTIYIFADWEEFDEPMLVGMLRSDLVKAKEHFSFTYDEAWLASKFVQQIDPALHLYAGEQHNNEQQNFRIFLDSCPDRWGRLLMKRREAVIARREDRKPHAMNESDYLLGVHDMYRMGALRFKLNLEGAFLDNNEELAAPPITTLRDLEYAASQVEDVKDIDDPDYLKWLNMLISPGSSLGGARPKSCVIDVDENLWIAKFPSAHDNYDVAAWEYVAYKLAIDAGVNMSECRLEKLNSPHHTFLTQRFDRTSTSRLHFTSAMMQLGYDDGEEDVSYLELAQFLTDHGSNTKNDLAELWRRIVFNIAVSNTDDHLRNHGFIYSRGGWLLSPAYDINPVTPATGLHLNINENDNSLNYELAMDVIDFFQLEKKDAVQIKSKVLTSVNNWKSMAAKIGLGRAEQQLMAPAFNV